MPDFIPEALTKEVEVGGRKIALWVPVAGGLLAIGIFAIARLRGGGKGAGPAAGAAAQTTQQVAAETNAFTSALAQVEKAQLNINEQVAAVQEGFGATQAKVEGLGAQITGFQAQLGEQAQALQAGLGGAQAAQQAFKTDVESRIARVESSMSELQKSVTESRAGFTPSQKIQLSQALMLFGNRIINPIAQSVGAPEWSYRINAQTGNFEAMPAGAGYWQRVW